MSEEFDELEATFQGAVDDFMSVLGPVTDRLTCTCAEAKRRCKWPDLYAEICQALNAIGMDLNDYLLPELKEADEPDSVLFDSSFAQHP